VASRQRTPEQIRADIAATRHTISTGVEGLVSEVHPTTLKNRAVDDVKQTIKQTFDDTRKVIFDTVDETRNWFVDSGGVRWNNVGTVALVVGGAAAVFGAFAGAGALIRRATK